MLKSIFQILMFLACMLVFHGWMKGQARNASPASDGAAQGTYGKTKVWTPAQYFCKRDNDPSGVFASPIKCVAGEQQITKEEYDRWQTFETHKFCVMYPTLKDCDIDCVDPALSKIVTIHALGDYKTCPAPYKGVTYPTSATVTISFIGDHDLSGPHPVGWVVCTSVTGGVASTGWCPPADLALTDMEDDTDLKKYATGKNPETTLGSMEKPGEKLGDLPPDDTMPPDLNCPKGYRLTLGTKSYRNAVGEHSYTVCKRSH